MLMYAHVPLVAVGSHARVARPTLAHHAGGLVDSDDARGGRGSHASSLRVRTGRWHVGARVRDFAVRNRRRVRSRRDRPREPRGPVGR